MEKDFLQSEEWRKFQESVGKRTFVIPSPLILLPITGEGELDFSASIIEHKLPIVGNYFYIPRGPIISEQESVNNEQGIKKLDSNSEAGMTKLLDLARENNASWVRFDAENEEMLEIIKNTLRNNDNYSLQKCKIEKSPHDMQPKEVFIIDITKPEEEILAEMKQKTRYNIKLAEKKEIKIIKISNNFHPELISGSIDMPKLVRHDNEFYLNEFLRLTKIMAKRQGITPHSDEYYRKMFEIIPSDMLKLYVAAYDGKVVAANMMVFYKKTAIYLHGASDDKYKNLMAPYLLQWQAIKDAKVLGCEKYDFGGIKTEPRPNPLLIKERGKMQPSPSQGEGARRADEVNSWAGITRFKTSFSPKIKPTEFFGSYDIIIDRKKYLLYRLIQKMKSFIK